MRMVMKVTKRPLIKPRDVVNRLSKVDVLIGIPQEANAREDGGPIGNAALLMLHTVGSPVQNIPPRPTIQPTIAKHKRFITDKLKSAMREYSKTGNDGKLRALGMYISSQVKEFINDPGNGLTPNSPRTIRQKGSALPLVDTGELRNSITYVIRKR